MTTTRRLFAQMLPFLAGFRKTAAAHPCGESAGTPLLSGTAILMRQNERDRVMRDIMSSFDSREWAAAFVAHVKESSAIATDVETIEAWFANALMTGYFERNRELTRDVENAGAEFGSTLTLQAVRGAVARGWCADVNAQKIMDGDLAEAITQEVLKLAPQLQPGDVLKSCPQCGTPTPISFITGVNPDDWCCGPCYAATGSNAHAPTAGY